MFLVASRVTASIQTDGARFPTFEESAHTNVGSATQAKKDFVENIVAFYPTVPEWHILSTGHDLAMRGAINYRYSGRGQPIRKKAW